VSGIRRSAPPPAHYSAFDMTPGTHTWRTGLGTLACCCLLSTTSLAATNQEQPEGPLIQLRQHTEAALARGDLRSAEMLIETFLPAAQRLADPTWQLFIGHRIACRIKLGLNKLDEAAEHSRAMSAIVTRSKRTDTMENAIAAITEAQVLQKQGRPAAAADMTRTAITALRRAHERGRITRRTFETELLAYEEVLIQATTTRATP